MFEKLERLKSELQRNRERRAELDEKIRDLERRITEEEKTSVHDIMKAANLSPIELARLISFSKTHTPMSKPIEEITKKDDDDE